MLLEFAQEVWQSIFESDKNIMANVDNILKNKILNVWRFGFTFGYFYKNKIICRNGRFTKITLDYLVEAFCHYSVVLSLKMG